MQNSGLGSGLAKTPAFAAQFTSIQQAALAPVPAAISVVWHVLIGSILASYWRRKVKSDEELCNALIRIVHRYGEFWPTFPLLGPR